MSQSKISKYCVMATYRFHNVRHATRHSCRHDGTCHFLHDAHWFQCPLLYWVLVKYPLGVTSLFPALQKWFFVPFLLAVGMHHDALACELENDSLKTSSHCNYPLDSQNFMSYTRYWCVVLDCPVGFIGTLLNTCISHSTCQNVILRLATVMGILQSTFCSLACWMA